MLDFKSFLVESDGQGTASAKHQDHYEDVAVGSHEGFNHAVSALRSVHNALKTGNSDDTHISIKQDGSPAVVYGHHPKTGKFFVATKHSAYPKGENSTPRLATTHAEVDEYFGHSPVLAQRMHASLQHLPKIAPRKGIFQGDYLHDSIIKKVDDNKVSFKPNTITYHVGRNTPEGERAIRSQIGFSTHTKVDGDPDRPRTLTASPLRSTEGFRNNSDVDQISPRMNLGSGGHLTDKESKQVEHHLKQAETINSNLHPNHHDIINKHAEHFSTYINQTVRTGEKPTTQGLRKHIQKRMQKEVDKMKTEKGKAAKTKEMNAALAHHDAHEEHFSKALDIHHHVQQAKNIIVSGLDRASKNANPMRQTIDDKETNPEGYVIHHDGKTKKIINRQVFSRANFAPKDWKK